ncbi:hypothetical protein [Streptomyces violaceusniger]|uniref:Uncharacterized protein n=1 Tax=Streptomyces violaceusniger (strain Tu 4113) TaxID=653045 RepID=G2PI17_STRV4|nr:hypothetical protein [Streptomyces violaceusniger]AEM88968.1 hypothetical protein Strvi_0195 [Streptomyces violaceusniger Tu 4113]
MSDGAIFRHRDPADPYCYDELYIAEVNTCRVEVAHEGAVMTTPAIRTGLIDGGAQ